MQEVPCPNITLLKEVIKEIKTVAETKWLRLEQLYFVDHNQKSRIWDRVVRTTAKDDESTDAGAAVALGVKDGQLGLILVAQFRPPTRQVCLEFPAGLVDANDSDEATIVRELKEETGYIGTPIYVSPRLVLSPGMGVESMKIALVWADPKEAANVTPVACCDDGENIEVVFLPLDGLRSSLEALSAKGVLVFDAVYTFAMGLELARELSGNQDIETVLKKLGEPRKAKTP